MTDRAVTPRQIKRLIDIALESALERTPPGGEATADVHGVRVTVRRPLTDEPTDSRSAADRALDDWERGRA